jgi:LemA protein
LAPNFPIASGAVAVHEAAADADRESVSTSPLLALAPGGPGAAARDQILSDSAGLAGFPGEAALIGFLAIAAIAGIASFASHFYALVQTRLDIEKAWAKLSDALARRRTTLEELLDAAKWDDRFEPGIVSDTKRLLAATPEEGAEPKRFAAELKLSAAIGKVLATSQNYPTLANDPAFRKLDEATLDIEEEIERRREIYNAQVEINNTNRANFIQRFIAALADVDPWEHFPESTSEALAGDASRTAAKTLKVIASERTSRVT